MKKYIFTIIIFILLTFCIIFPEAMINSTKSALTLWATIILPSLFPFMILINLIQKTALPLILNKLLSPIMQKTFKLPGTAALAISLGMIGGYPIGAKITVDMLNQHLITKKDANHLITFVNNTGPLFMLGAVGIGLYNNKYIGLLLLISHYIVALIIGFITSFTKDTSSESTNSSTINFQIIKLSDIGIILNDSIKKATDSVLSIGGFVILFSIISSLIKETKILALFSNWSIINPEISNSIVLGLLEVTNGINKIATVNTPLLTKLILTSCLIGFGGMSIHFQTLSILTKSGISFIKYILGKLSQGLLSGIITYLLIAYTNFSKLIPQNSFSTISYNSPEFGKILNVISGFLIFLVIFKLLYFLPTIFKFREHLFTLKALTIRSNKLK